jgi:hypothetical protein
MFEVYFEAQELCFCEFWHFEGVGQMCSNFKCLRQIVKPQCYVFVCFGFLKVWEVKGVLMLNV